MNSTTVGRFSTGMERRPQDDTIGHFAEGLSSGAVHRRPGRFSLGQEDDPARRDREQTGSFATGMTGRGTDRHVRTGLLPHGMTPSPQEG